LSAGTLAPRDGAYLRGEPCPERSEGAGLSVRAMAGIAHQAAGIREPRRIKGRRDASHPYQRSAIGCLLTPDG
jgi:hypothetical protein